MEWDSAKLRELVEQRHGPQQRELFKHRLNSLAWKVRFARYHASEVTKVMRESMPPESQNETTEFAKQIMRAFASEDERLDFNRRYFVAEANLIAFAQSLHSVADIMAGVVYLALDFPKSVGIDMDDLEQKPYRIANELESRHHAPGVAAALRHLVNSEQFRYLRAYVNVTKHRSLVITTRSANFLEDKHGIRIGKFRYKDRRNDEHWPEKWAIDFVGEDFIAVCDNVFSVGQALNDHLVSWCVSRTLHEES